MRDTEQSDDSSCCQCLSRFKDSRRLILMIVAIAILLDNMLLTSVVPIIPSFLYHLRHEATENSAIEEETPLKVHHLPTVGVSRTDDNVPQFLRRWPPSTKDPFLDWDVPGFTVVPNEVFYKFTATSESVENGNPTKLSAKNDDSEVKKKLARHEALVNENFEVGFLFASKPLVQAIANPFVGTFSSKVGYSVIMFLGFLILFTTSLAFAIGNSYTTLFLARALQGVGSACTSVAEFKWSKWIPWLISPLWELLGLIFITAGLTFFSLVGPWDSGMGTLAEKYPEDAERGNAMAIALGGLALGVLIGPVYGGTLYEFVGKAAPFLILAVLAVIDGLLQLIVLQPKVKQQEKEDTPLLELLKDPYIMVAAGAITFSNIGIAVLEPSLPLWMMDTMDASKWQQGAAFLPASISYLIGTNLFGPLGHKMGRWLAAMIGLFVIGVCLICVPFAKTVEELIPANAGIGFAIGMVDSSMMPMLGYLVDIRHTSVYGCVYAIADIAFCLGFIIGPVLSATIVEKLGFEGSVCAVAFISFIYAPLMVLLRNPPGKNDLKNGSQSKSLAKYMYSDDESVEAEALTKEKEEPTCY